ncbi:MAG: DNA/RNA nuclease SfsA [Thermodesulfobacteriota bacterium]
MLFDYPLQPATLLRRYKRFLADVELADGRQLTVHCPNTGSMLGCSDPGLPAMISRSDNPKRKYPHTLEMVKVNGNWVGINTSLTNRLVREALENSLFPELGKFAQIKPEVKTGNSRLDFLLSGGEQQTYVEVKNCTLARGNRALFPDAVTARGTKHLKELPRLHEEGHRAALIFCVQMSNVASFSPASDIDPVYAETLAEVAGKGVLPMACRADVTPEGISIKERLPVEV